jgi:hypothetical protein
MWVKDVSMYKLLQTFLKMSKYEIYFIQPFNEIGIVRIQIWYTE